MIGCCACHLEGSCSKGSLKCVKSCVTVGNGGINSVPTSTYKTLARKKDKQSTVSNLRQIRIIVIWDLGMLYSQLLYIYTQLP